MKLLHGNEMHFVRCPDGRVYSPGVAVYSWWQEYLRVFDEVEVAARVRSVNEMYSVERQAEGPGVTFCDLPDFRGPQQFVLHSCSVKQALCQAVNRAYAFLFRVPGTIGYLGARELILRGRPYGYEVVGDPFDVFSAGSVNHPLRRYFRHWHTRNLKRYCDHACAVSYVTENALQRRYPPNRDAYTSHYSDVGLKPESFVSRARTLGTRSGRRRLLFVGTLEQLYKAPDVLIKAVGQCCNLGLDVSLTIAGDGAKREILENLTARSNLMDKVFFVGHVAGRENLLKMLDESDLFVLPSRAEGLPRAMLEAMARAVPCIGSTVDGIPELLASEDLVPPGKVEALASKIAEVLRDPERQNHMSARCLAKAHDFELETMRARKIEFLTYLREASISRAATRNPTMPVEV